MKIGNFYVELESNESEIKNEWKTINFYFCIDTKKLILEPNYFCRKGRFYWQVKEFSLTDVDLIYNFCKRSLLVMTETNLLDYTEQFNLLEYFKVKTYTGVSRKIENFQFCWTDWQGFYFTKGKRNSAGFTFFIDTTYEKFDNLSFEEFLKGYSKCINRILKKIDRKEIKNSLTNGSS